MIRFVVLTVLIVVVSVSVAVAECPSCDVPTGYENGIHNVDQYNVVVMDWEQEVEEAEVGLNELCCCCFTTDYFSKLVPTEPVTGYDCNGSNPACMKRGMTCQWVTETAALIISKTEMPTVI